MDAFRAGVAKTQRDNVKIRGMMQAECQPGQKNPYIALTGSKLCQIN
jgi:hypothetical protein